jgi:replicative DNA helicase
MTIEPADDSRSVFANIGAEQGALGAMMLSETAADLILDIGMRGDAFYDPKHVLIYAAIVEALAKNEPADPVALATVLAARGDLVRAGGVPYLHTLVSSVPTAANGPYYARIVADFATRRGLIESSVRIDQIARDFGHTTSEAVDMAQSVLHVATVDGTRSSMEAIADLTDGTLDEILSDDGPNRGISTGLGSLDDVIGGLKPGQLVIVAGRPGGGKSVISVDFARAAAIHRGIPVGVFSLEMTKSEVMKRIYSAEADVNLSRMLNGGLSEVDKSRIRQHADRIRRAPLYVDDTAPMTLGAIRSGARRLQQRHGLGLVVVDYVQLVRSTNTRESRVQEVTDVSSGLKLLAKELGVPIVAACQLNRNSESRTDRRPALTDLRESGSLEQDADVVILLHRPDYSNPEHERAGEIDLIVAKNRHGATETVTCAAQLDKARIVDFEVKDER